MNTRYYWRELKSFIKEVKFKAKHKTSRSEVWNVFHGTAVYVDKTLGTWIKLGVNSRPGDVTAEEWDEILKKIHNAFHLIALDDLEIRVKQEKEIDEGLDLFRKWYFHLWD